MIQGTVNVTSRDHMASLLESLKKIKDMSVLVGVPEENSDRPGGDDVSNPELVYIHTHGARAVSMISEMKANINEGYSKAYGMYIMSHGSPLWRIPPRPIIEPAIEAEDHKEAISEELGKAARSIMDIKPDEARNHLGLAGQLGEDYARDWFEDPRNNWPPNAQGTIEAKGSDRPLIDTAEMRKSITHVLRQAE